jgi:3-hydroxyisobutyrate dehydrogenase-like beta-hydroxyacid dehydrogenase
MNVTFCGLGNMGRPMAIRLVDAGHDVTVWNRSPERAEDLRARGAAVATTPREAAERSKVAITMLSDPGALTEVVFGRDGLAGGLRPGTTLIDMSTVGPDAIRSVASTLPDRVEVLDAPVRGGPDQAARGELGILVGGSESAFGLCSPLFEVLGTARLLGPLGSGAAAKLVNNFAVITLVSVLGEAISTADAVGLDEETALEILADGPLGPTLARQWGRATGEGPPSFGLRLAAKDLALGVEAVRSAGRRAPVGEAAVAWLRQADAAGLGDADLARVIPVIRAGGAAGD